MIQSDEVHHFSGGFNLKPPERKNWMICYSHVSWHLLDWRNIQILESWPGKALVDRLNEAGPAKASKDVLSQRALGCFGRSVPVCWPATATLQQRSKVHITVASLPETQDFDPSESPDAHGAWPIIYCWLVVWNMAFIFPYIGNSNPN